MPSTPISAPTATAGTDRLALGTEVVRGAAPGSNPPPGQCYCSCACFEAEASTYAAGCAACCCFENE